MTQESFSFADSVLAGDAFRSCRLFSSGKYTVIQSGPVFCDGLKLLLREIQNKIFDLHDKRYSNYVNLDQKLDKFIDIEIVFERNELVAMAMIQQANFPVDCPRVMSRTFLSPKYRKMDASIRSELNVPTSVILPLQIRYLESIGMAGALISIENPRKRKFCQRFVNNLNDHFGALGMKKNWSLLPGLYQTCPAAQKSCWQNILFYQLAPKYELPLPKIEESAWHDLN